MSPLVSVIIPNYNHAEYLDQRIQSILDQTYDDYELIILDDCSTDRSHEIIEKYRTNSHVSHIIYNEKNSGSTFIQWQRGLKLARGKYIWIAESDDYADRHFLKILINNMECQSNIVLAFSGINYVDTSGSLIRKTQNTNYKKEFSIYSGDSFIHNQMLVGNAIANASAAIFLKEIAMKIPKDYMTYKLVGDRLFWIEIAKYGNVYETYKHLDYFRQHETNKVSVSAHRSGIQMEERYRLYKYMCSTCVLSEKDKRKVIGENLYIIIRSKDYLSRQIKKNIYKLWSQETMCPIMMIGMTIFNRILTKLSNIINN